MDYNLDAGSKHLPEIKRLSKTDNAETDDKLLHYTMEGIRLNGTFGSYRRSTVSTTVTEGDRQVPLNSGDKVFVSFVSAARDPKVFPNPDEVVIDRPIESYIHYDVGEHSCLGKEASMVAPTTMLRTVGKLDGLRGAPGPQGELMKIPQPGGFYVYMREDHGSYFVFPFAMKAHYDGVLPYENKVVNGT
jgi:linoleate 10R-lipoxygenase